MNKTVRGRSGITHQFRRIVVAQASLEILPGGALDGPESNRTRDGFRIVGRRPIMIAGSCANQF